MMGRVLWSLCPHVSPVLLKIVRKYRPPHPIDWGRHKNREITQAVGCAGWDKRVGGCIGEESVGGHGVVGLVVVMCGCVLVGFGWRWLALVVVCEGEWVWVYLGVCRWA